ncbi:AraC family transcriptional regulator [Tenacibaculum amylolyticum]|uniref:AraC family transcriptional regulator n=1 Tax=Tenacibaculum amylolyticum TaxID=104269 RepID=UPI0038943542
MKALPFKIPKARNLGVIYQEDIGEKFYDTFHQHEEIQISIIIKGTGTLIVGDTIHNYKSSDIFVIGSNLPHVFKSDTTRNDESFMISLFFTQHSFGKDFFHLDDFSALENFFQKSLNGFKITTNNNLLLQYFLSLRDTSSLDRFIIFFKILQELNVLPTETLANFIYPKKYNDNHGKRMQLIMDYTVNNYDSEIDLAVIAAKANMTKNAFCRYFKQRTNKTYFTFLHEFRIENACKLLLDHKDISINEVAYKCGYNSLSNFNRKFLLIKGVTPSRYRKAN